MVISGAIFDFDGTILDSMPLWSYVGTDFARDYLKAENPEEIGKMFFSVRTTKVIEYLAENICKGEDKDSLFNSFNMYLMDKFLTQCQPKCGSIEFIKKLYAKGVKMCIASASDEIPIRAVLEKYDILKCFEHIFTDRNVGVGKKEPIMFRKALELMGSQKDTTYVFEDALYSAKTAVNDGFKVVGIYDETEKNGDELKAIAERYIYHYNELEL